MKDLRELKMGQYYDPNLTLDDMLVKVLDDFPQGMTLVQIAGAIQQYGHTTIYKTLAALADKGLVRKEGSKLDFRYYLCKTLVAA